MEGFAGASMSSLTEVHGHKLNLLSQDEVEPATFTSTFTSLQAQRQTCAACQLSC